MDNWCISNQIYISKLFCMNLLVTTSNYGNVGVIGSVSCCLVIFSSLLLFFLDLKALNNPADKHHTTAATLCPTDTS